MAWSDEVGDVAADESPVVIPCDRDMGGVIDRQVVFGGDRGGLAGEGLVDSLQSVGTSDPHKTDETRRGCRGPPAHHSDIGYLVEREVERCEDDRAVSGRSRIRRASE